jgi:hypothetical protein
VHWAKRLATKSRHSRRGEGPLEAATGVVRQRRSVSPLIGDIDCRPLLPFATIAARSTLALPTCPRGRRGQGPTTQLPAGARDAPRMLGCTPRRNPRHIPRPGPARSDHRSRYATCSVSPLSRDSIAALAGLQLPLGHPTSFASLPAQGGEGGKGCGGQRLCTIPKPQPAIIRSTGQQREL